jgi:hypothetical protein
MKEESTPVIESPKEESTPDVEAPKEDSQKGVSPGEYSEVEDIPC